MMQVLPQAMQLATRGGDFTRAPNWFSDALVPLDPDEGAAALTPGQIGWVGSDLAVCTLNGVVHMQPGDWLIRGVEGELYPCERKIFAATYERAPTGVPLLGS